MSATQTNNDYIILRIYVNRLMKHTLSFIIVNLFGVKISTIIVSLYRITQMFFF